MYISIRGRGPHSIPYCAESDEARLCEAFNIRAARIGIPYRAKLDEARPCAASDIRDARMGMFFRFLVLCTNSIAFL